MCKFADVLLNQYLTCWCEKMGDLSGLPVQVFGIFVHFDSYISRLDIHLLLLPKSVLISMRWGWNIHVPNFLPGACAACVTLGRHWARRAAAKMDVVVFGHIFQARRGEVRGGMVIPWSCLGHTLVMPWWCRQCQLWTTINIPPEPHLQGIIWYFATLGGYLGRCWGRCGTCLLKGCWWSMGILLIKQNFHLGNRLQLYASLSPATAQHQD